MKDIATVTSKGQITVPLAVRARLGLKEGDRVIFVTEDGRTTLQPLRGEKNAFADFAGALSTFAGGAEEIKAWVRDMRDDDCGN